VCIFYFYFDYFHDRVVTFCLSGCENKSSFYILSSSCVALVTVPATMSTFSWLRWGLGKSLSQLPLKCDPPYVFLLFGQDYRCEPWNQTYWFSDLRVLPCSSGWPEVEILLPKNPKYWDYRCAPSHLALNALLKIRIYSLYNELIGTIPNTLILYIG
jgi:hypothetical protein